MDEAYQYLGTIDTQALQMLNNLQCKLLWISKNLSYLNTLGIPTILATWHYRDNRDYAHTVASQIEHKLLLCTHKCVFFFYSQACNLMVF